MTITMLNDNNREAFYALAAEYLPGSDPAKMAKYAAEYPRAFLAAEEQGQVIGVVFGWPRRFADPKDASFELNGVAITYHLWRHGYGRALLAAFEREAQGYGAKVVSLGSADGFVEEFYIACGYIPKEYKVWTAGRTALAHRYADMADYLTYQRPSEDGFVVMEKELT